jgi:hypothetical protein
VHGEEERGGGETHRRLGREEGRPEEEIDAELQRAGGAPAAVVLHLRSREKWCGVKRRPCSAFYRTAEVKGR